MKKLQLTLYSLIKECFLLKTKSKARMFALATPIQHYPQHSSQCNKGRKRNKINNIGKKKVKLFLFVDYMFKYIENPMVSMNRDQNKKSEFIKVKTQNSIVIIYKQ